MDGPIDDQSDGLIDYQSDGLIDFQSDGLIDFQSDGLNSTELTDNYNEWRTTCPPTTTMDTKTRVFLAVRVWYVTFPPYSI